MLSTTIYARLGNNMRVYYSVQNLLKLIQQFPNPEHVYISRLTVWADTEKKDKWWGDYYEQALFQQYPLSNEFWDEIYRISCELGVDFPQYKRYNIEFIEDKEYEKMLI